MLLPCTLRARETLHFFPLVCASYDLYTRVGAGARRSPRAAAAGFDRMEVWQLVANRASFRVLHVISLLSRTALVEAQRVLQSHPRRFDTDADFWKHGPYVERLEVVLGWAGKARTWGRGWTRLLRDVPDQYDFVTEANKRLAGWVFDHWQPYPMTAPRPRRVLRSRVSSDGGADTRGPLPARSCLIRRRTIADAVARGPINWLKSVFNS